MQGCGALRVLKMGANPLDKRVMTSFMFNHLAYLEMKEVEGELEAFLIFFLFNRHCLQ